MNALGRMLRTGDGLLGLILLALLVALALAADVLYPGDPLAIAGPADWHDLDRTALVRY